MKKCFVLFVMILLMAGCNKEANRRNDTPDSTQISPTQIVENASDTISPAAGTENNSDTTNPDTDTENISNSTSPTPGTEPNDPETTQVPSENPGKIPMVNKDITTPILVKGLFMGGISQGRWMKPDEFYQDGSVNLKDFSYDVYKDERNSGTAIGGLPTSWMTGEPVKGDQYNQEFCIVELYDKDKQKLEYDIALQAEWDLFPRAYEVQNTEQTKYMDLIKDHLKESGLENPDTTIKQIIRVDLEDDGTEEVLIAADNTTDDRFEEVKKGDNAVLLFRKLVDGEVMNQVIEQDIRLKEEEYPSIYMILSRVETIADLDGDDSLEVIIKSWYYEGAYWSIYKLIDNKLELVTSNGYGA